MSKNNNVRFDVNFALLFTILQVGYNNLVMGFNDNRLTATDILAVDAPLAYSIDQSWGMIAVTSEAHSAYGLEPKVGIVGQDKTFAELSAMADEHPAHYPMPGFHLLIATPAEVGQEIMPGNTVTHSVYRPRSLQITVASGSEISIAQADIDMDFSMLAESQGVDDLEELHITDTEGLPLSVSELKSFFVQQQTVLSMARALGSTIASSTPEWLRNDYNARFMGAVRNAGIAAIGATAALDALAILANHGRESLILSPFLLALVGGVATYKAIRQQAESANDRERLWRSRGMGAARLVTGNFVQIYQPVPPQSPPEAA